MYILAITQIKSKKFSLLSIRYRVKLQLIKLLQQLDLCKFMEHA